MVIKATCIAILLTTLFASLGVEAQVPQQATESEVAREPAILSLALSAPRSWDPLSAIDSHTNSMLSTVYDSLYVVDDNRTMPEVKPAIAAALPEVSADGLSWRIPLRSHVLVHPQVDNGAKRTARYITPVDVAASLKRVALREATISYIANQVRATIVGLEGFSVDVEQARARMKDQEFCEWLAGQEVDGIRLEDNAIRLKLTFASKELIWHLASVTMAMVPLEAISTLATNPIGTGPFRRSSDSVDTKTRLIRFRKAWGSGSKNEERADGSYIEPDEIVVHHQLTVDECVRRLRLGGIDRYFLSTSDSLEKLIEHSPLAFNGLPALLEDSLTTCVIEYIGFNMLDGVVGTPGGDRARAIRRAVSLSVDREALCTKIGKQGGVVASSLVPPGTIDFPSDLVSDIATHDPIEARQLLRDAGLDVVENDKGEWVAKDPANGNQVSIQLYFRGQTQHSIKVSEFLVKAVGEVGIKVLPELVSFPDYLRAVYGYSAQSFNGGWVFDYPQSSNFLSLMETKSDPEDNSSLTRYSRKEFDLALAKLRSAYNYTGGLEDSDTARSALQEVQKCLDEDAPVIPLYWFRRRELRHSWTNSVPSMEYSWSRLRHLKIDPTARSVAMDLIRAAPVDED